MLFLLLKKIKIKKMIIQIKIINLTIVLKYF